MGELCCTHCVALPPLTAMRFVAFASLFGAASAHGHMTFPSPRDGSELSMAGNCKLPNEPRDLTAQDGQCRWFSQGCQPGCDECETDPVLAFTSNPCKTPMEPTVTDVKAQTWNYAVKKIDWTKYNPWRSPGWGPILSPCGIAGGGDTYHPENGALPPKGVPQGKDGLTLPISDIKTEWAHGTLVEVAWSVHANHGGGYAYRLCPKTEEPTEECFAANTLKLNDESYIQYGADRSNRTAFSTYRITEGTYPAGSQWTRNPIPACGDSSGGEGCAEEWGEPAPLCATEEERDGRGFICTEPPMFEPPLPGLFGYGWSACFDGTGNGTSLCSEEDQKAHEDLFKFNIIDELVVPDLPVGDYWLSFRWDCEQTPQIWAQCGDVTITNNAKSVHAWMV